MSQRRMLTLATLMASAVIGCAHHDPPRPRPAPIPASATTAPSDDASALKVLFAPSRPAYEFYMGDHLGMNLKLTLLSGGGYALSWHGCEGLYGSAVGKWALARDTLTLAPVDEQGSLKEHPIRTLRIRVWDQNATSFPPKVALIPEEKMPAFIADGAQDHTCFRPTQMVFGWFCPGE